MKINIFHGIFLVLAVALFGCEGNKLPIYTVTQDSVVTDKSSGKLAEELGIEKGILDDSGAIRFMGAKRFLSVPMKAVDPGGDKDEGGGKLVYEGFDLDAIAKLTPPAFEKALAIAEKSLRTAELIPKYGKPIEGHTAFEAVSVDGKKMANALLDTHVSYQFELDGMEVVGSGSQVNLVFDTKGKLAQLTYALRDIKKGKSVTIISKEEANKKAYAALRKQIRGVSKITDLTLHKPELVYYAPPLSKKVTALYPHYSYGGEMKIGDEIVELQKVLIPAIRNAPQVKLHIETDPKRVNLIRAKAEVTGGNPPYDFSWSSAASELDAKKLGRGARIEYTPVLARGPVEGIPTEVVSVSVTDSEGLVALASITIEIPLAQSKSGLPPQHSSIPRVDAGAEASGECAGLPHSRDNAYNFRAEMLDNSIPVQFIWTEWNAWEQDFKDPALGGDDSDWVDDVDAVFFSGHGGPNGFSFCNNTQDDNFLHKDDARWGNRDLEWLGVDACSLLALESGGQRWWQRWGPAFKGLHLFASFKSVNYDTKEEGRKWARNMLVHNMTVRQAWAQMSIDTHGSDVEWAVMGVIGSGSLVNWNDHFWGHGSVGPDLSGSSITGYWLLHGPS